MSDAKFASWFSRILRWMLAAGFAWAAYAYNDLKVLYLFSFIAFITGFLKPKRCLDDSCSIDQ